MKRAFPPVTYPSSDFVNGVALLVLFRVSDSVKPGKFSSVPLRYHPDSNIARASSILAVHIHSLTAQWQAVQPTLARTDICSRCLKNVNKLDLNSAESQFKQHYILL